MAPALRFSIIIPAHDEESYIERTLEHVTALSYPKDAYEVLVVENGSRDRTFEIAKSFEGPNLHVLKSEKGVSKAKNLGIDRASPASDWIVFLDADTVLEKEFLLELDDFLREPHHGYTVGTTSVRPLTGTLNAVLWFKFYDLGHRLTKASYSIKLVKRSLFPPLRFDETLTLAEDLRMIAEARKYGTFFFLPTRTVFTSTRRFDKEGWWKIFFSWTFGAILPRSLQQQMTYKVIR